MFERMNHRATSRIASSHRFARLVAFGWILAFLVLPAANRLAEGTVGHLVRSSAQAVGSLSKAASLPADRIRPSAENPRYWSYNGRTVLLIGGSIEDNLFQIEELEHHLDVLVAAGGNYIRNTMSSRDPGNVWPFDRRADGLYDLDRLSDDYFGRFERLLELALERDIIVQIELWDRFDFVREPWLENPYRPANNATYSPAQSGLENEYPRHPNENENPFFRTVPANENNVLVLGYQQAQVDRMLDISLRFPNVLYTMDNETNGTPEWGAYWADYILRRAADEGVEVYTTEMWDNWDIRADQHKHTLDHPHRYGFADISQNNHNSGDVHWERLQWARDYVSTYLRPLNNVKIYGADSGRFGSSRDGIERFWRNVVGGAASARFHRPESGIGLSGAAQTSIRSARLFAERFDLFRAVPDADGSLLSDREGNEAFLSRIPGEAYAVYFPNAGSVSLDLGDATGTFAVHWLDVPWSQWRRGPNVEGGRRVALRTPDAGHWVVVLTR